MRRACFTWIVVPGRLSLCGVGAAAGFALAWVRVESMPPEEGGGGCECGPGMGSLEEKTTFELDASPPESRDGVSWTRARPPSSTTRTDPPYTTWGPARTRRRIQRRNGGPDSWTTSARAITLVVKANIKEAGRRGWQYVPPPFRRPSRERGGG